MCKRYGKRVRKTIILSVVVVLTSSDPPPPSPSAIKASTVSVTLVMGARNQVGIGLSYRPASLLYVAWLLNSRLGSWNRFLAP